MVMNIPAGRVPGEIHEKYWRIRVAVLDLTFGDIREFI